MLHADESPITVLDKAGNKGSGYIWAYASGQHENIHAVVFEIKAGRGGQYARDFLVHERQGPPSLPRSPGSPGSPENQRLRPGAGPGIWWWTTMAATRRCLRRHRLCPPMRQAGAAQAGVAGVIVEVGCGLSAAAPTVPAHCWTARRGCASGAGRGLQGHVRRKFFELHVASRSEVAKTALDRIG